MFVVSNILPKHMPVLGLQPGTINTQTNTLKKGKGTWWRLCTEHKYKRFSLNFTGIIKFINDHSSIWWKNKTNIIDWFWPVNRNSSINANNEMFIGNHHFLSERHGSLSSTSKCRYLYGNVYNYNREDTKVDKETFQRNIKEQSTL